MSVNLPCNKPVYIILVNKNAIFYNDYKEAKKHFNIFEYTTCFFIRAKNVFDNIRKFNLRILKVHFGSHIELETFIFLKNLNKKMNFNRLI